MATLTGKTLGKYQVLERIGRGGMADVYKGLHPRLKRDVAIKVLHSHLAEGPDFLARFEREARAVAALRHPHIVQVYDFDADEDIIYMVMEFVKGGSLKARQHEWVSKGEYMPFKDVIGVINEVGEALDYAHAQTMIHRDVKPANIMLDQNGSAVLTDFGIARIVSDTQFTATGALIGTPAYMSPEQGKGEPLSDESDLYGLGIILYELLTNQIPFDADTPLAIIHKQVNEPLPSARSLRPELPGGVDAVLAKVLAKNPEARYTSGAEFTGALMVALDAESMVPGELAEVEELAPTVVMAETEVEEELEPTVVMEEEGDSVDEGKETIPDLYEDVSDAVDGFRPETVEESAVGIDGKSSQETRKTGMRTWVLIIGGLAIVAILVVLVLSGVFQSGSSGCLSFDECTVMADEALEVGDPEAAIGYFDRALDMASGEPHPPYAELWCRRADATLALDRVDEAISSFEICIEWTEGDPGLEGLRMDAIQRIDELYSGSP